MDTSAQLKVMGDGIARSVASHQSGTSLADTLAALTNDGGSTVVAVSLPNVAGEAATSTAVVKPSKWGTLALLAVAAFLFLR
ncbi:MAG: hypothetical protein ACM3Q1_05960 [Bacteroidales bacterium]